ncbi:MAG: pyruvate, water dikinase [Desulfovibrionaceae bacterium CG1_02_65_16]|nr:MAG: pyruvate, water dikinase [Desulfovibrionaceae bacterium CG1_02_65_16]
MIRLASGLVGGLRGRPPVPFSVLYKKFKGILERHNAILELIGDMGDKLGGDYVYDRQYILDSCERLGDQVFKLISDLNLLCQGKNVALFAAFERIQQRVRAELAGRRVLSRTDHILPLSELTHDLADEGGNKMASLGDIRNILGFPTPQGFVITAGAYFEVMERAGLRKTAAETVQALCDHDGEGLEEKARVLRQAVLTMPLPRELRRSIERAVEKLTELTAKPGDGEPLFAVRSSAWDEDSESSFAGMYETVLGVGAAGILDAYRQVLASLFCEEALRYRLHHGLCGEEPAMAVGVMPMVDALVSGGLYTYAPLREQEQAMVVSAAWGLGKPIVDGTAETDTYILLREPPHDIVSSDIAEKSTRLALDKGGGTRTVPVAEAERGAPCLTPAQLALLAKTAMTLEHFFKRPLDVEWALTPDGALTVLQARPLSIRPADSCARTEDAAVAAKGAKVLLSGRGITAMGGVSAGPVHLVTEGEDPAGFPYGAVLVARHSSPRFAKVMPKCRGIITDVGSATGHMATIARELRVPTLVQTGSATRTLREGQEITLDADHQVVYEGLVEALCQFELVREDVFEESWEYRTLKRVLKHISPLTLLDPKSEGFTPEACRTFHDIARYVHQRSVDKLTSLAETHKDIRESAPRQLITRLPLGLTVIDVEGGLSPAAAAGGADPGAEPGEADIACRPLRALMEGLNASGMWDTNPVAVDMGSFMSSVTRTLGAEASHPTRMGRNLAVISREYLNLHLRLGYHFTVVDAFIGGAMNDNAIAFRFMGGVTDLSRRSRRATLIAAILERSDFLVEVKGDMVTGRIKKHPTRIMLDKMFLIGALIGYTRQLDAKLDTDGDVALHQDIFLQQFTALRETRE